MGEIDLHEVGKRVERTAREAGFSGVVSIRRATGEASGDAQVLTFGFEDRARRIPITARTRFAIASGAKTFTSVAICRLVESGALSLDAPLRDCLDVEFPRVEPGVTVRHLLQHTSGLPDYFDEEVMDDFEALWRDRPTYSIRSPRDFLPLFREEPMKFAPGSRFAYNNAGYIVLGLIAEQAARRPFPEIIAAEVFAPAGMTESGYFAMDRLPDRVALGYIEEPEGAWRTNVFAVPIVGGPDGGVFTTAGDLDRFWDALLAGNLVAREMREEMLRAQVPTGEERHGTHYGHGFWVTDRSGASPASFMVGSDPGVEFYSARFPREGVSVTMLANSARGFGAVQRHVRTLVCGE